MDEPEGKMESPVEDWKPSFWAQRGGVELNASPGVILDNCVLGKAKEGSTEVHAHGGIPAITVILERAEEEAEMSEGKGGRRGRRAAALDPVPVVLLGGHRWVL